MTESQKEWNESIRINAVEHADWPGEGTDIVLDIHDLPHASSNIEWWYCNGHLSDTKQQPYSVFASFFRTVDNYRSTSEHVCYLHALTWGLVDVTNKIYYTSSLLDHPSIARLLNGSELAEELDKHLYQAYTEVLTKGVLPRPDRISKKECSVDQEKFRLNYDENLFFKDDQGCYHLSCMDTDQQISFDLQMEPMKAVCRQGHEGVVNNGSNRESMFYYFIPRLKCQGQLTINGQVIDVQGHTWYDHEFGGCVKYNLRSAWADDPPIEKNSSFDERMDCAWYWFSIQLDNGYELTMSHIVTTTDHSTIDKFAVVVGPKNERTEFNTEGSFELKPLDTWISVRTASRYPTKWQLSIPAMKCELWLEATIYSQEFITILSRPAFWEGRMEVRGRMNGQFVQGQAFFECHGTNINILKSLDRFFKRISRIVLKNVAQLLPRTPTLDQAIDLVADQEHRCLVESLNLEIFAKTIIDPLRDITDRGGKAWRSYLCLLCIDCVGGDSRQFEHWLALPEIFHVGSLIVDDIQDQSEIRRGGPACHLIYGTAQAINAGTAAYFLPVHSLIEQTPALTMEKKLHIYETAFLTLRAAHIGQGLDIHGLDYLMDEAVETGDALALERAILCIHRLKSGVPAGCLARLGAIIGGGTKEHYDALEQYVQSIGVAFQIIDDVLNLRGFEKATKQRGEDLMAGKITFPVAKAMDQRCLSDPLQRKYVWETIQSKSTDIASIEALIDVLERCGSVDQSVLHAQGLVEEAWTQLDPCISNSFFKLILRAFGLYILERHYWSRLTIQSTDVVGSSLRLKETPCARVLISFAACVR